MKVSCWRWIVRLFINQFGKQLLSFYCISRQRAKDELFSFWISHSILLCSGNSQSLTRKEWSFRLWQHSQCSQKLTYVGYLKPYKFQSFFSLLKIHCFAYQGRITLLPWRENQVPNMSLFQSFQSGISWNNSFPKCTEVKGWASLRLETPGEYGYHISERDSLCTWEALGSWL